LSPAKRERQVLLLLCALVTIPSAVGAQAPSAVRRVRDPLPGRYIEVIGRQGLIGRFVIVSPDVASQDDALFEIAEYLRRDIPVQIIQAMFWTDRAAASSYAWRYGCRKDRRSQSPRWSSTGPSSARPLVLSVKS
jgi:hypothetical protein